MNRHDPSAATRWRPLETLSLGGWVILLVALASTAAVLLWPIPRAEGIELWTFARNHAEVYQRLAAGYNERARAQGEEPIGVFLIDGAALQRRVLSGFWSGTPLADLVEVERGAISNIVAGPIEDVGFVDLTERIEAEGLDKRINAPSFAPWTSRGRIFGLPHDVHPTLLVYRADLVEAAGIDVSRIETWADFERVMRPLVGDLDGDGRADRFLLNLWYTQPDGIEALLLQAGGGTFDADGELLVGGEANARVVAQCVAWMVGPDRIAVDAPNFDPSGNQLKLDGRVVCDVMPDWLAGIYKSDLPQLGGKLKLMPLPAWEPGGRRTSVIGGTMIGVPKAAGDFEAAWRAAKYLYLSRELAEELFRTNTIISPVREFWDSDFYREPDPYFSGQPSGTLFIDQAPDVPFRSSSPFHRMALTRIIEAVTTLYGEASAGRIVPVERVTAEALLPRATALLAAAEARVRREMSRNVFLAREADYE